MLSSQDVLVYQAPLIRNITSQADPLTAIDSSAIPNGLSLSLASFVDFALLIGTDFTHRLRGLGPHRALKLLQSHGSIEEVLEAVQGRFGPSKGEDPSIWRKGYLERVNVARRIFERVPRVDVDESGRWQVNDHEGVVIQMEMRNETGLYDPRLVSELLEGFELSWLASRSPMPAPIGDGKSGEGTGMISLQEDYFDNKAANDHSRFLGAESTAGFVAGSEDYLGGSASFSFADDPRT